MHRLSSVSISLTNRCNLDCRHCGNTSSVSGAAAGEEMSRSELQRLFSLLRAVGVELVGISGGEPLLRHDFQDIMQDLAENGLSCMLLTNGMLLDKRMVRFLAGLDSVESVRLSVEFPPDHDPGGYHPSKQTFAAVGMCAGAGVVTGVNMTLFPENLCFAKELAQRSFDAGASYFRAVPVFPTADCHTADLPVSFLQDCIVTVLGLHTRFGAGNQTIAGTVSMKQAAARFAMGCGAGSSLLSIDADGSVSGCPLAGHYTKKIRWDAMPFVDVMKLMRRRTRALQRQVIGNSGSTCSECGDVVTCRGGCLAEWNSRGRPVGQASCYMRTVYSQLKGTSTDSDSVKALYRISESMNRAKLFGGLMPCMRAIPLWTVWHGNRVSVGRQLPVE